MGKTDFSEMDLIGQNRSHAEDAWAICSFRWVLASAFLRAREDLLSSIQIQMCASVYERRWFLALWLLVLPERKRPLFIVEEQAYNIPHHHQSSNHHLLKDFIWISTFFSCFCWRSTQNKQTFSQLLIAWSALIDTL